MNLAIFDFKGNNKRTQAGNRFIWFFEKKRLRYFLYFYYFKCILKAHSTGVFFDDTIKLALLNRKCSMLILKIDAVPTVISKKISK